MSPVIGATGAMEVAGGERAAVAAARITAMLEEAVVDAAAVAEEEEEEDSAIRDHGKGMTAANLAERTGVGNDAAKKLPA